MTFSRIKHGFLLVTTLENRYEKDESSQGFNIQKLFVWIRIFGFARNFQRKAKCLTEIERNRKRHAKTHLPNQFCYYFLYLMPGLLQPVT